MMSEKQSKKQNNTVSKPPRRYPPRATREISVASTFSPLEWMVDILQMNETDIKSNDEHIRLQSSHCLADEEQNDKGTRP